MFMVNSIANTHPSKNMKGYSYKITFFGGMKNAFEQNNYGI